MVADGPAPSLAGQTFSSSSFSRRILSQLRVRAPAEDDDVANHDAGGGVLKSVVRKGQQREGEGRSRRKSGLTVEPSRRCGRWRDGFQELGSMVNNRSLRIHPDELFEPFSASSKSTETARRQGFAILSFQARNRCLQHQHSMQPLPAHSSSAQHNRLFHSRCLLSKLSAQ